MEANYQWHARPTREGLAAELTTEIEDKLRSAIAAQGQAVLALSGGSTPKPLFEALAKKDLAWENIVVTLVDERWVPSSHDLSNEAFMREFLLDRLPSSTRFAPLYFDADSAQESLPQVLQAYCELTNSTLEQPKGFDVTVLGMGDDGHTASFFPDADNIEDLVNPDNGSFLMSCESPTTQVARITWTVPMLLNTSLLVLHITGQSKQETFTKAIMSGDTSELPIRSALFQQQTELQVFYAD